jgi:hypothetical protein
MAAKELPRGMIIAWYGTSVEKLPDKKEWLVCNGENGTPDLRGKFIQGVVDVSNIGLDADARATHMHHGSTGASSDPRVSTTSQGNDDLVIVLENHTHGLSTNEASHIPPNWKLIYLMKT